MIGLKICFWNANGIRQHKNEVDYFLKSQQIDIMLISETHLTERSFFRLSGYTFYNTKDPRGRACGGSGVLVKSRLKHYLFKEFSDDYLQATAVCIEDFQYKFTVSSVYFPPRYVVGEEQYSSFFKSLGSCFLAAGDFNAKHTFWGSRLINPKGRCLFKAISRLGLSVISSGEPTYWPADRNKIPDLIDFGVIKGIPSEILQVESSYDLSSDHSPTIVKILRPSQELPSCGLQTGMRINWLKYKKYLSTHCSENVPLRTPHDVDQSIEHLEKNLKLAAQHAKSSPRIFRERKIYFADVEELLSEKRRLRRAWQRYRSPRLKSELRDCTNRLQSLLESRKTASLRKYLENLDATANTDYSLWRAAKNLKRPVLHKPPLRKANGDWARDDEEKAKLFANHLSQVFSPNIFEGTQELPHLVPLFSSAANLRFCLRDIEETIGDLSDKKAPGVDQISNRMIKELPHSVRRLLLYIFNAILRLVYYPQTWKISLIIMIPKPGKDHTKVESYRPISLLSNVSKLFEKAFTKKLIPMLNVGDCIPNHQFGFRRQHSTIEQTHRLINVIRSTFEEKKYCSALFIDVSQAFDKVWHEGLIHKMKQKLPSNISHLLQSYLTGRKFRVKEGEYISEVQAINAGVPQGSVLGPILYLLYTSDMPTCSNVHTSTFADDTAFLSTNEDPQEATRHLQNHVVKLETWLKLWRIKINENKCTHVTFTLRRESCPAVLINNQTITQRTEVKYLGMHLDRRLTWKPHIEAKVTQLKLKTIQLNWLIGRNSVLGLDCKLLIYNSILKPIWCYGVQLWGTASATNLERIQRQQNKILRMMTNAPWYVKNANIHKDLSVPMVKEEIVKYAQKHLRKLEVHPNPLARAIVGSGGHIRLKRRDTMDLVQSHPHIW